MKFPKKLTIIFFLFLCISADGQIITKIAGNIQDSIWHATGYYFGGYSGDGRPATAAQFSSPCRIQFDVIGNLYIADNQNMRIRKIDTDGIISTFAGNGTFALSGDGGPATAAGIGVPTSLAIDNLGNIYIGSGYASGGGYVRKVDTAGIITTIAGNGTHIYSGDGPATATGFTQIEDLATDKMNNVYVADELNSRVTKISPNGFISTICGTTSVVSDGDGGPASAASLLYPHGLAIDTANNIYICDGNKVRRINAAGIITTIAGDDNTWNGDTDNVPATATQLRLPDGIAIDTVGNIYIAERNAYIVRRIDPAGIITTVAGRVGAPWGDNGDGGPATAAALTWPAGLTFDKSGNLYIADEYTLSVKKITGLPMIPMPLSALSPNVSQQSLSIHTWPDPNSGIFNIHLSSHQNEQATIMIANILGEIIKELITSTNTEMEIKLYAPPGLYFITAITAHEKQTAKIIIE